MNVGTCDDVCANFIINEIKIAMHMVLGGVCVSVYVCVCVCVCVCMCVCVCVCAHACMPEVSQPGTTHICKIMTKNPYNLLKNPYKLSTPLRNTILV